MYNCIICNSTHGINKNECLSFIKNMVINCNIKYNIHKFNEELNLYTGQINKKRNFACNNCKKIFTEFKNLKYHLDKKVCHKIKEYKCEKCNKVFEQKKGYQYHVKNNVCENKVNIQPNSNLVNNISNVGNTSNVSNVSNTANNTQNIGTQININVNANSTEDLKKVVDLLPFRETGYKVSTEKYLEYASNPAQAIKQFIKEHHFNPDKPERLNILNTNRRDNRVQLFDYDDDFICRWQTKDKSKIIELLYDRGMNHLFFAKMMLDGAGVKLDAKKEKKLKEQIKEYENEKVKKKCLDMISDMTYDYRELVESNKKNIEKQQKLLT